MKKIILYLLVIFILSACGNKLSKETLKEAIKSYQEGNYNKALDLVDSYLNSNPEQPDPTVYYYKGFFLKDKYNKEEKDNPESPSRLASIDAFASFLEVAPDSSEKLIEGTKKSIKYLLTTIYNDAALYLNIADYKIAVSNFEQYKELTEKYDPETDLIGTEIQFNLVLANVYMELYEQDRIVNQVYFDHTLGLYNTILEHDSMTESANYNAGILYYNEAVYKIRHVNDSINSQQKVAESVDFSNPSQKIPDIKQLLQLIISEDLEREEINNLFSKAKPYFERVYRLNPEHKNTLIALTGIYFSLNDLKKSEDFKKKAEALEQKTS